MVEQAPGDADEGISRQPIHFACFLGVLMITKAPVCALVRGFEPGVTLNSAEAQRRQGLRSRQILRATDPVSPCSGTVGCWLPFSRSALIGSAAVSSSRATRRTRSIIAPSSRTLSSFSLRRIHRLTCP